MTYKEIMKVARERGITFNQAEAYLNGIVVKKKEGKTPKHLKTGASNVAAYTIDALAQQEQDKKIEGVEGPKPDNDR